MATDVELSEKLLASFEIVPIRGVELVMDVKLDKGMSVLELIREKGLYTDIELDERLVSELMVVPIEVTESSVFVPVLNVCDGGKVLSEV